jgi:hypothetical protein
MVYWGTTSSAKDGASQSLYQNAQGMLRPALPPQPKKHSHEDTLKSGDGAAMEVEQNAITSAIDQMVTITGQANRLREKHDLENARTLGYLPECIRLKAYEGTVLHAQDLQDLVDEVEERRYYVILMAYDFQTIWKSKQRKMLWETRFSIRERRNDFSKALAAMAQNASRYFGQDSKGLIRERLPDTRVILGEPTVVGYEQETKK